jgi:hypothetical protein
MKKTTEILQHATLPIIISLFTAIFKYFIGVLNIPVPDELQSAVYSTGIVSFIWIIYIGISVQYKFGTTLPLNRPRSLWRLIYNKIPYKQESEIQDAVDIALIYDSKFEKSEEVIENIIKKYSSQNINIIKFDYSNANKDKSLHNLLFKRKDPIDAIYFLLTNDLSNDKRFTTLIEQWGKLNDDKPILHVDYSDFSNENITYGKVSKSEADVGLWRLLVRSAQRARVWKEQAKINRRYFFGQLMFVLLFLTVNYFLFQNKITKDKSKMNNYITELNNVKAVNENICNYIFSSYQNYAEALSKVFLNNNKNSLSNILQFHVTEIQSLFGLSSSEYKCKLSIWKQYSDSIRRLAINSMDVDSPFPNNDETIIGTSFSHLNLFILWKAYENLKKNDTLIWDSSGNPLYRWNNERNEKNRIICVRIGNDSEKFELVYKLRPNPIGNIEDHLRGALLCLTIQPNDNDKYGVCLEFEKVPVGVLESKLLKKQMLSILSNSFIYSVSEISKSKKKM